MDNENTYNTKYGAVSVSTDASSNVTTLNLGLDKSKITVKAEFNPDGSIKPSSTKEFATTITATPLSGNTFGIQLRSDGSINPLTVAQDSNTVEIDDDPTNTYGLASKKYVRAKVKEHADDSDAHKTLFNNILKQITDLYEEKGELRAYKISDDYGNVINANGKCILNGDKENPKYIVFSSEKNPDIGEKITELSGHIDGKQTKLTVGDDLTLTESGSLCVTNMRYDDTSVVNSINALSAKERNLSTRVTAIEGKESGWDSKQDRLTFDTVPTCGSLNPVTSNGIFNAVSGYDSHVESTSLHLSSGERTRWDSKQDALTFDTTPTCGSLNPVTSNGIFSAVSGYDSHVESTSLHLSSGERELWGSGSFVGRDFGTGLSYDDTTVAWKINDSTETYITYGIPEQHMESTKLYHYGSIVGNLTMYGPDITYIATFDDSPGQQFFAKIENDNRKIIAKDIPFSAFSSTLRDDINSLRNKLDTNVYVKQYLPWTSSSDSLSFTSEAGNIQFWNSKSGKMLQHTINSSTWMMSYGGRTYRSSGNDECLNLIFDGVEYTRTAVYELLKDGDKKLTVDGYVKPVSGIPQTDFTDEVKNTLSKATSAVTTDSNLIIKVVDEEPETKEPNTLYFIVEQ